MQGEVLLDGKSPLRSCEQSSVHRGRAVSQTSSFWTPCMVSSVLSGRVLVFCLRVHDTSLNLSKMRDPVIAGVMPDVGARLGFPFGRESVHVAE